MLLKRDIMAIKLVWKVGIIYFLTVGFHQEIMKGSYDFCMTSSFETD
jgi:hypothetical protein